MRVLIVGAGNVGVVYAQHLRAAGADVAFVVKPSHVAAVRAGIELTHLGLLSRRRSRLEGVSCFTDWSAAAAEAPWDWVLLTVPPPALRAPDFVPGLRTVLGAQGSVLGLILGLGDEAWLTQELGPGRLATGEIVLISFSPPLDGPKGTTLTCAYFLPPFAKAPLSGPQGPKLHALAELLTRGRLPAHVVPNARTESRLPAAGLFALVSALKLGGWRFSALARGDALPLGLAAAREREVVLTALGSGPSPRLLSWFSPRSVRVALWCAARVLPFPLEAYLRVHFTKVNQQFVDDRLRLIEAGTRLGLPVSKLQLLHQRLV